MQDLTKLKIPDGWTLDPAKHYGDQAYLHTPSSQRFSVTVDFTNRGFRSGMSTIGTLHGDDFWKKTTRKKYTGRGWAQALIDDAVAHLREVM